MGSRKQEKSFARPAAFSLLLMAVWNTNDVEAFSSSILTRTCREVSFSFGSFLHETANLQPIAHSSRLPCFEQKKPTKISKRTRHRIPHLQTAANDNHSTNAKSDGALKREYNSTKQTLQITGPALIGMLVDPLLSLMDTAYVGRLGTRELAALGACTSIFHLAFNAFRATTTATTSLVASALQRDPKQAQEVTSISLKLVLFMGLCVLTGLRVGSTWCLGTMGISPQSTLFSPAKQYLSTRLWAAPVVLGILV